MYRLKKFSILLMIIGVIGIALNTLFGYNTITYLEKVRIENGGLWYYKYNFSQYVSNLSQTFSNTTELNLNLPTRQWTNDIINNLALMLDYIIVMINILLYPLRVGAYMLKCVLAIMGINMIDPPNTGIKWILDLITQIIPLQIPYI